MAEGKRSLQTIQCMGHFIFVFHDAYSYFTTQHVYTLMPFEVMCHCGVGNGYEPDLYF